VLLSRGGPTITGTFAGLPYRATTRTTDVEGNFKVDVPKGLRDVVIEIDLSNTFQGARGRGFAATKGRWRLGKAGRLQDTSKIRLGTLERDFSDLEIVYTRDEIAGASSPDELMQAQVQSIQALLHSGQITIEQANEAMQALAQRQQGNVPANAGQPAQQPPAAGRGRANGRATATGRSGRAATTRGAPPAQQSAEETKD